MWLGRGAEPVGPAGLQGQGVEGCSAVPTGALCCLPGGSRHTRGGCVGARPWPPTLSESPLRPSSLALLPRAAVTELLTGTVPGPESEGRSAVGPAGAAPLCVDGIFSLCPHTFPLGHVPVVSCCADWTLGVGPTATPIQAINQLATSRVAQMVSFLPSSLRS